MKDGSRTNRAFILLSGLAFILVLAGLGLLAFYFFGDRSTPGDAAWGNPIGGVRAERVAPDLAVLTLAGEPVERVARAALEAGETETAYATLAYSVFLPDHLRSGQWLLLARAYGSAAADRAGRCYRAAFDHVALAPDLSDLTRADIALQTGRGFAAVKEAALGQTALAQAEAIGRYSVVLLPAQRRTLLEQVAAAYQDLGQTAAAQQVRQNLAGWSAGVGVSIPQQPAILPTLRSEPAVPSTVTDAIAAREQAAAAVAARWLSAAADERATLAARLSATLLAEDAARTAWYAPLETQPLPERLAVLHDQLAWLTVKLRVARGGYGLALVPAWVAQAGEFEAQLTQIFTDLINGYGRQLDTLDPVQALSARVELLRQGLLWARLGIFGGAAEAPLREQLLAASLQLWTRQGDAGLRVVSTLSAGEQVYLLSGAP